MKALILSFTLLMTSIVPGFSQKDEDLSPAHSLFAILVGREQSLSGFFRPRFPGSVQVQAGKVFRIPNGPLEIKFSKLPTIFVQSKPYSAEETIQETWTRYDKTQESRTLQSTFLYRDSVGKTRIDWPACYPQSIDDSNRKLAPNPNVLERDGVVMGGVFMWDGSKWVSMNDCAGGRSAVPEIIDPVAGYRYYLDSLHQVAYRFSLPPSAGIPQKQTQYEFLGVKTIDGIEVQGIRFSTTIDKFIATTESWVSNELMIGVLRKSSLPGKKEISQTMKNIKQAEPDVALFKIPSDYKIVDGPK
jgi:hypothetical protein